MEITHRIVEVSCSLFLKRGIRGLTMGDLARELGISKRTLYEHFNNKEQLLLACLDFWEEEKQRVDKEIASSSSNPVDVVHKHFQYAGRVLPNVHSSFFDDLKRHYSGLWRSRCRLLEQVRTNQVTHFFESGIREGYFRPELNHEIAAKLFFAQVEVLHDNEVFAPEKFSKADVILEILIIFLRGICTEKGIIEINRLFYQTNP